MYSVKRFVHWPTVQLNITIHNYAIIFMSYLAFQLSLNLHLYSTVALICSLCSQ